jgi:hypothetical protein
MRFRTVLGALALVAGTVFVTRTVVSDDKKNDQEDWQKAWEKLAAPGPEHKRLEAMAGTFDAVSKFWTAPDAPPAESKASSTNTMVLGGRYLHQEHHGTMFGKPFEGIGYSGYDNTQRKYTNVWMDNASTLLMTGTGTADASGKVMTSTGEWDDPGAPGKKKKWRTVLTIESADKHTFEMFEELAGKECKSLEIVYTRKK